MNKFSNQQSGASLILTVLIVSIFSISVLAVGRVLTSEIRLNSDYGSQEVAYWAAESGVEKGLLYLANNHQEPVLPVGADSNSLNYLKTDLDNNQISTGQISDGDNDISYNFLKVYDQVRLDKTEYLLEKDQGISLRPTEQTSLLINWDIVDQNENPIGSFNCNKNRLYIRINKNDGSFETRTFPSQNQCNRGEVSSTASLPMSPSQDRLVQIKAFLSDSRKKIELKLSTSDNSLVGGRYIYIESIGQFNSASKKILAKIDREEIGLPNMMDYVIFSEDEIR